MPTVRSVRIEISEFVATMEFTPESTVPNTFDDFNDFNTQSPRSWNNRPVFARIQTVDDSSFLVFEDEISGESDSDQEDLDRITDIGLREQVFITLSRCIRSEKDCTDKITEVMIPNAKKLQPRNSEPFPSGKSPKCGAAEIHRNGK